MIVLKWLWFGTLKYEAVTPFKNHHRKLGSGKSEDNSMNKKCKDNLKKVKELNDLGALLSILPSHPLR